MEKNSRIGVLLHSRPYQTHSFQRAEKREINKHEVFLPYREDLQNFGPKILKKETNGS